MSRHKTKRVDYQKSKIAFDTREKHFFRIFKSSFYSDVFQSLSGNALKLYIGMGLCSNGNSEFTFPYSAYSKTMSKTSFSRAKKELLEKGFIEEVMHFQTRANIYKLSDIWKSQKTKSDPVKYYDAYTGKEIK